MLESKVLVEIFKTFLQTTYETALFKNPTIKISYFHNNNINTDNLDLALVGLYKNLSMLVSINVTELINLNMRKYKSVPVGYLVLMVNG